MAKPAAGSITALVYGYIRDSLHRQAIKFLEEQLKLFPDSHAALSLLGYCHYYLGDFSAASSVYEKLSHVQPMEEKYRIYHAQSLYKASMLTAAEKVCSTIEGHPRIENLKACISYEQEDITGSKAMWEQHSLENFDVAVNLGCCLCKEESYEEALAKFASASNTLGFEPDLAYNKAFCFYHLKRYGEALKILSEIIDYGIQEYPELSVGSNVDGMELCSVGNSQSLKSSKLVEAFNLKAAIEYVTGHSEAAKLALKDMPPRIEEELDSVTLHNQALFYIDADLSGGFRKLNFLLQNPPFPPETYTNLLLLYCKPSNGYFELAALLMKENPELTCKCISQELHDYLDAIISSCNSVVESYQKLNELAVRYGEAMRRLIKQIQDTHISGNHDAHRKSILDYESLLDNYVPVIMAMAKIFWDKGNYAQVDRIFQQSSDLCSDHPTWKLNVAHNYFMQDNKYNEAIQYYEPVVKKCGDNVLGAPAIVLANLCVSYIMTSQNEDAEDLMRKIEKEEERTQYEVNEFHTSVWLVFHLHPMEHFILMVKFMQAPEKQCLHLCIVNLVIGTLYCAKQNFEFGISRIIKSLDPISKKLDLDTWFYAKRCFLALADNLAKQMIMLRDSTYLDIDEFLDMVDLNSKLVLSHNGGEGELQDVGGGEKLRSMITREARLLKRIFLKCRE